MANELCPFCRRPLLILDGKCRACGMKEAAIKTYIQLNQPPEERKRRSTRTKRPEAPKIGPEASAFSS